VIDLLAITRFKNLKLYTLIEESGGARQVALSIGMNYSILLQLTALHRSPVNKKLGTYTKSAKKIAEYFMLPVEELFPPSLYKLKLPEKVFRAFDSTEILPLLAARGEVAQPQLEENVLRGEMHQALDKVLVTLTPREEKVLKMHYGLDGQGEHSLEEIGEWFRLHRSRVQQIKARALKKLRHPSRTKKLKGLVYEGEFCEEEYKSK
jgi:RNA polymerase sigma factor (sigma-70 family)